MVAYVFEFNSSYLPLFSILDLINYLNSNTKRLICLFYAKMKNKIKTSSQNIEFVMCVSSEQKKRSFYSIMQNWIENIVQAISWRAEYENNISNGL